MYYTRHALRSCPLHRRKLQLSAMTPAATPAASPAAAPATAPATAGGVAAAAEGAREVPGGMEREAALLQAFAEVGCGRLHWSGQLL